jgi:hypothetical protein
MSIRVLHLTFYSFNLALTKEVGLEGIRVHAMRLNLITTDMQNIHDGIAKIE